MSLLVLGNDLTNAHHIDAEAARRLAYDADAIEHVGGHEAQSIYAITRTVYPLEGDETATQLHTCHVVANVPSPVNDAMLDMMNRKKGKTS